MIINIFHCIKIQFRIVKIYLIQCRKCILPREIAFRIEKFLSNALIAKNKNIYLV